MDFIKRSNWYLDNNELKVSLLFFQVSISAIIKDNELFWLLNVKNSNNELNFEFDTMEKAVTFTEDRIADCRTFEDVIADYEKYYVEENKTYKKTR